jgi:predicted TIM-barrel fold metal-dependent hydrolase
MLLQLMPAAGVDYAIVVHPQPYQDDHRYLEYCLTVGQGKLKGTCLFFADQPDTGPRLRELVRNYPAIVAVRIHAYDPEQLPPLWTLAGDLGLAVQLHFEPRYAPGFEPYLAEFRSVRVLVDHLGRPAQGTPAEHQVVLQWARFDHVMMKLSSVPDPEVYPHRNPAPVIAKLVNAYGADRLMYGGGFGAGATATNYRAERERIAGLLPPMSEADRAKVFGETAAKVFGFGPVS